MHYHGNLRKMQTSLPGLCLRSLSAERAGVTEQPVTAKYTLQFADEKVCVNDWLGKQVTIKYAGIINCIHCKRVTKKSFSQGYCYPCFMRLAECDMCIIKPEKCHYEQGTCRDNDWAHAHCMQPHIVYLANSSGLKVGITRRSNIPSRWVDQGAIAALPIMAVHNRYQSGMVEITLAQYLNDKTNWRKMLKNEVEEIDLHAAAQKALSQVQGELAEVISKFKFSGAETVSHPRCVQIQYPVQNYPKKINSFSLDKQDCVQGELVGIKGQYLIFADGVMNIRKFGGYAVEVEVSG